MLFRMFIIALVCFFGCFSSPCWSGESLAEAVGVVDTATDVTWQSGQTWESLYKKARRAAKRLFPFLGDEIADIVQDSVVKLLKHDKKVATMSKAEKTSYIYKSVKSTGIDFLKKAGTRLASEKIYVHQRPIPSSGIEWAIPLMDVTEKADPKTKGMLEMRLKGQSAREIGQFYKVSKGTVMSRLRRVARRSGIVPTSIVIAMPFLADAFYDADGSGLDSVGPESMTVR